jgi:thermitase
MLRKFQRRPVLPSVFLIALISVGAVFSPDSLGAVSKPARVQEPEKIKLQDAILRNWGLENNEYPSHIEARKAWKLTQGSHKVVVAVVDTGIDPNHVDLRDNLWHKPGTDEYGWDFVKNRKNPLDDNSHGSHIAGIIGATLRGHNGAAGVSPNVSIMPVRYYSESISAQEIMNNIVKSIEYAVDNGAQIINISSEGTGFNTAEYRAIEKAEKKGVLVVVAAGNQGVSNDTSDSPSYPASYDLSNIIAVAATNIHNGLLPVSNFGTNRVHVAAPGENIFSTLPHSRYGYLTGTSQATAFVSGLAALMLSVNPALKPTELKKLIMASVDKSEGLKDKVASGGRINAFRAVQMAMDAKKTLPGPGKRAVAAANLPLAQ